MKLRFFCVFFAKWIVGPTQTMTATFKHSIFLCNQFLLVKSNQIRKRKKRCPNVRVKNSRNIYFSRIKRRNNQQKQRRWRRKNQNGQGLVDAELRQVPDGNDLLKLLLCTEWGMRQIHRQTFGEGKVFQEQ